MTTTQFLWLVNAFVAGMGFTMLLDTIADRGYPARAMAWCRERSWVKRLGALAAVALLLLLAGCAGSFSQEWQPGKIHPHYPHIGDYTPRENVHFLSELQEGSHGDNTLKRAIRDFNKVAGREVAHYCRESCGFVRIVVRRPYDQEVARIFGALYKPRSEEIVIKQATYGIFLHEVTHAMGFPHTRVPRCLMSMPYSSVRDFCDVERRVIRKEYQQ